MHEIDFLPDEYRKSYARRRNESWRILVVVGIGAIVLGGTFVQGYRRQQIEVALAAIAPEHDRATARRDGLTELQSRLKTAQASAELFTYLRHPWPRTQILAALLAPLPDDITFEQLEIRRESPGGTRSSGRFNPPEAAENDEASAKLPPAARDLNRLRDEFDKKQTVVSITGVTAEAAALYRYLIELGNVEMFSSARAPSSEIDKSDGNQRIRFNATLIVRPGYGQPGGPAESDQELAATAGCDTI